MTRDFTATTFIVRDGRTFLLYHRKLQQWFPPGGHIHPNELPCDAAVREVREETGLEVELLSSRSRIGRVEVLCRPECILLEPISEDHQHVDLIYFARVVGGRQKLAEAEAEAGRWYAAGDLDGSEIAEDIRKLGKEAIGAVAARVGAGNVRADDRPRAGEE